MTTKYLSQALLVALLGSTIVACSNSADTTTTDSAADTKTTDKPKAEQTLAYGGVGAQPVQDPHGALFNETDWVRLRAVYDTLIATDHTGKHIGGLAKTIEPNADASEWTITLKEGITFADGSKLTAADVLSTMQRMDKKKAENGMRLATIDVAKSKVVNDTTVKLATTTPDADLPRAISGMVFVVKKGTEKFAEHNGAGAYTVEKAADQATTLARREKFWGEKPALEKITIYNFADPQALAKALTSKKVDVAASLPPVAAKTLKSDKDINVIKRPGAVATPLLLRVDSGPFAKPEVRQAVKYALDREKMVKTVYSGYGVTGKDMMKLTDPSVPQNVPEVNQDLEKAKALMAKAGVNKLDVTLHTTTAYPSMKTTATVAKEQLKEIGINVTIKEHEPSTYWSKAYTVEPFTVGYWVDTPFATTIRQTALSTSGFSETGWKNKTFDTSFAAAMAKTDATERNTALGELHKQMAAEGGWVVWGFGDAISAARSHVNGLNTKHNMHDLTGVSIGG